MIVCYDGKKSEGITKENRRKTRKSRDRLTDRLNEWYINKCKNEKMNERMDDFFKKKRLKNEGNVKEKKREKA